MFQVTDEFLTWIKPLLYYPEEQILLHHTRMTRKGIGIHHRAQAEKKYRLSRYRINTIIHKLEWLAILYELEVAAYPDSFL